MTVAAWSSARRTSCCTASGVVLLLGPARCWPDIKRLAAAAHMRSGQLQHRPCGSLELSACHVRDTYVVLSAYPRIKEAAAVSFNPPDRQQQQNSLGPVSCLRSSASDVWV